jgi:putative component of toxin-antitoxin plasmid stabilization module
VKIRSINDQAGGYFGRVNEKQEKESFSDASKQQQDHSAKEDEKIEVTEEKVNNAIQQFSSDEQTKGSGLSASRAGSGPGLKIVLKDKGGSVIRELSGEEFLKLRSLGSAVRRGKILDQKL